MSFGEIVSIKELISIGSDGLGKCFRITGFVNFINAGQRHCQINHEGYTVAVNLSLVDFSSLRIDSLCQVLGEVVLCQNPEIPQQEFMINAKVLRLVDGLDMKLYEKAVAIRRDFLAKKSQQHQQKV